ncbi:DoxX family protein [Dyadobacter sp. CY312]|uniref:DoxX family protein n=1 Tax=Dyadobacter sp. CY312 TaxID=2907303 RepID=UPI001F3957F0|nr:DoxX family protein [Dyadobacter sp. CY312]MCE7042465.1 DoxX family protein [Dyadobacter sp. CY312]
MATQQKTTGFLHIALWSAQVLLAASMVWGATMKLFTPIDELSNMWPWAAQVSPAFLNFTAIVDILGALGLILPALLRIQPTLTPIAAVGIVVLMISAAAFHIQRDEASQIGANVAFAFVAIFIAWGRFTKAPIAPK